VINLVTGDVYTAVRNEGAYKNGKKIVCKKNSKCVFAESTKSGASKLFKINENFSTRKLGCACLAICFVAEGMADACVITGGTRTIEAATYLITKEAGGIVTDLKGKKIEETKIGLDVNLDLMISSNKEIHSKILSLIKKVEPWVIWITGLPGSGKSATSRELLNLLEKNSIPVQYLQLDVIRKTLVPNPKYDEEERDYVYRSLMLTAKYLSDNGINVVLDATCHKREWRALARELIKNYYEVYLKCPLKVCMERETGRKSNLVKRELYMKASERLKSGKQFEGIGQVPGIDVEYEEPENPDLTIESDKTDSEKSAKIILEKMKSR
jgi:adenylylsulfate kinase